MGMWGGHSRWLDEEVLRSWGRRRRRWGAGPDCGGPCTQESWGPVEGPEQRRDRINILIFVGYETLEECDGGVPPPHAHTL